MNFVTHLRLPLQITIEPAIPFQTLLVRLIATHRVLAQPDPSNRNASPKRYKMLALAKPP